MARTVFEAYGQPYSYDDVGSGIVFALQCDDGQMDLAFPKELALRLTATLDTLTPEFPRADTSADQSLPHSFPEPYPGNTVQNFDARRDGSFIVMQIKMEAGRADELFIMTNAVPTMKMALSKVFLTRPNQRQ